LVVIGAMNSAAHPSPGFIGALATLALLVIPFHSDAEAEEIKGFKPLYSYSAPARPPFDQDAYDRCTVRHLKPGLDGQSRGRILAACERAATPKRCRGLVGEEGSACVSQCKEASWYARTLGDCSISDSPG
jgi:hypothetical protein